MRSGGGVYQPTTTGLADSGHKNSWSSGPSRFLGPGGSMTGRRGCPRALVLLVAGLLGVMGLVMVIVGARWNHELAQAVGHVVEDDDLLKVSSNSTKNNEGSAVPASATPYITVLVVGLLLMFAALVAAIAYYRHLGASLPCCPGKIAHIRQRMHAPNKYSSSSGVCGAQYRPPGVSPCEGSIASPTSSSSAGSPNSPVLIPSMAQPRDVDTPFTDVSEQQRLMSEESDRPAEDDPRIVLSPLKQTEEC